MTDDLFTTVDAVSRLASGSSWLIIDDPALAGQVVGISPSTVPVLVVSSVDGSVGDAVPLWAGEDAPPGWTALPPLGSPPVAACVLRHPLPQGFAVWCSATARPVPEVIPADHPEAGSRIAAALIAAADGQRLVAVSALTEATALLTDLRVELQRVYSSVKQANLRYHEALARLLPPAPGPDGEASVVAPARPAVLASPDELVRSLFDGDFYSAGHRRVATPDLLGQYRRKGWKEGRDPLPLFSVDWYLATAGAGRTFGEPLLDYLTKGHREGMTPHPLFDDAWYRRQVDVDPDVPPLVHYLTVGWRAGISPHPLFDLRWYRRTYAGSLRPDEDPLTHYLREGWRLHRNPHPLFDVDRYLRTYPDVAKADTDPLTHYVRYGWREDREPHPMFSTPWYRTRNVDLEPFEVAPLVHFVAEGWRGMRDPHPMFSVRSYLERYPDVTAAGVNPLVDFVTTGLHAGRTSVAAEALGVGVLRL